MSFWSHNITASYDTNKLFVMWYVPGRVISRSYENSYSVEIDILAIFDHIHAFGLALFLQ